MIDERHYELLDWQGYENKSDAYNTIRSYYNDLSGVTTYYDSEERLWYIVRSKSM